ncbi:hypothetical protein EXIGLDRAFT_106020 [Exidia glandulosa HHB12029]|uniref:Uncharacterized protein n=1 Tax=Exidia glandulosa HHB12029 TaxID=1314781 RepID=A0A165GUK0_EXIGL|nr:hypothetical protein EXIGLDRAFT_106020 [Exidia glandulosa HHB12029]
MHAVEDCMRGACPGKLTDQLKSFCQNPDFKVDGGNGASGGTVPISIQMSLALAVLAGSLQLV